MTNIKNNILKQLGDGLISQEEAVLLLKELQSVSGKKNNDIAIIGMSCRLPMAETVAEYWDNIKNGRCCFVSKPADKLLHDQTYQNPHYAEFVGTIPFSERMTNLENIIGPFVPDNDKFDAGFFNITPREAKYIDPGQRVFMETAWSAIEDAGYCDSTIKGTLTGVFVGKDYSNSIYYKLITEPDAMNVTGSWEGLLASRISYAFNLRGPAMVIDTACSSGLVAVHEACNALRNNECEMAIAGGISTGGGGSETEKDENDENDKKNKSDSGSVGAVTSDDGRVRTFDKKCSGSVFGEGLVVFVLKKLDSAVRDHDNIYAIIKGSAINNDGASNGITAPNPLAQENAIVEAWKRAEVSPESISYVEAHGTGTLLGDPIEILGLTNAFTRYTSKKQFCGIGSVKTNIGHLVAASGCANLLKVTLAMKNEMIPPSINFEEPNPNINFLDSPIYVVDKLTPWKKSNQPRRAGINAFGFSGTNCHMIVEEAPEKKKTYSINRKNNIIVFSGKTETAMQNIIRKYYEFFETDSELDFDDICYTANTGRGHYGCRTAIIADNEKELREKLGKLINSNFVSDAENSIYVGKHKVVSEKRQHKAEGEVSEKDIYEISQEASLLVTMISGNEEFDYQHVNRLAELYVKGAKIDWNTLYTDEIHYKVSIPTYQFDKISLWADPKITKIKDNSVTDEDNKINPFIDKILAESMNETIFQVNFSIKKHWVLKEHKIFGSNIVPGTTYIEIIKAACKKYFGSDQIMIKSLTFLKPLIVVDDDVVEAHIIIEKSENNAKFSVASRLSDESNDWVIHAEGEACVHDGIPSETYDVSSYADEGKEVVINISGDETSELAYMGPRWNCIKHIFHNGNVITSEVCLDDKFKADLKECEYHPSMADAALNIPLQVFIENDAYLPLAYKNLKIYGKLPKHFYSRLIKTGGEIGSPTLSFAVTFADENGNILAEIEEYVTKKVERFNSYVTNKYYGFSWNEDKNNATSDVITGNTLIFTDNSGVARSFANKIAYNTNITYVEFGKNCNKISNDTYCIDGKEESYEWLLKQLDITKLDNVFHFATIDRSSKDVPFDKYDDALTSGLYSLFFFPRVMLKYIHGKTNFYLVSDNAYEVTGTEGRIKPLNQSFISIVKTLVAEYSNGIFRAVDITADTTEQELYDAVTAVDDHLIVAVRNGKRYYEVLETVNVSNMAHEDVSVDGDGVYLITGGTGGLGLEIAQYLSFMGAKNICLLARKPIPAKEKWDNIISENSDRKSVNLVTSLKKVEENGTNVFVCNAEVSDYNAMSEIINNLYNEYGKIRGIIHCAGVAGDGFLYNKTVEAFNSVINPKIKGMAVIHELIKSNKPDFVVMFSSMQTAFGGSGQGDYTAANSFLDAYSGYLKYEGINAKTINWPGWSETGMAVDYNVSDAMTLFSSLTTQKALNAFDFILRHDISNVIPGELSYEFLEKAVNVLSFAISADISKSLERYQSKKTQPSSADTAKSNLNIDDLVLLGKDSYTNTEKTVAYIYASVLNITEVDVYENFNSMGGDSVLATEVMKALNEVYNDILNISDMFTYSCVMDMAEYIASKTSDSEEKTKNFENKDDMLEKLASGDIDVDAMLEYLDSES